MQAACASTGRTLCAHFNRATIKTRGKQEATIKTRREAGSHNQDAQGGRSHNQDAQGGRSHNQDAQERREAIPPFFSKGFNDKIAFKYEQWQRQIAYVNDNPRRYLIKKKNPDLFYDNWLISIGENQYIAKGNIFLLKAPQVEVVRFSRRFAPGYFEERVEDWKRCVENGGVLISPFIHPKENEMRKYAIAEGGSIIRICENGFDGRFAPTGEEFELNSRGRLLLIASADHNTRREDMTRSKAMSMNRIAELVAATDWLSGKGRIRKL